MKYAKNEKGMALITVILIFTVLTALGLVVFGAILNNTKQITKTEGDIQATDLAEMGVTYYKTIIQNAIEEVNKSNPISIGAYQNALRDNLASAIDDKRKTISGDNIYFETIEILDFGKYNLPNTPQTIPINNIETYASTDTIGVLLKSNGNVNGKTRLLSIHLQYKIVEKLGGTFGITTPTQYLGSPESCSNPSDLSGTNCVYTNTLIIDDPSGINKITNATLYFNEDFEVTYSIVRVFGGSIHVEGDFYAGEINNFKDGTNEASTPSKIEVIGNAEIGIINNTSDDFKLIVGGVLTIGSIGESVRDSTIIALNTVNLPSSLPSNDNHPYTICAFGQINGYTNTGSDRVLIPGESFSATETFESVCGNPYRGQSKFVFDGKPIESIEYE